MRKEAQNPIASLISVPIEENWNFGIEPGYRTQNVLNIQPVIPVNLGEHWNLIVRWITPVIYQPVAVPLDSGPNVQPDTMAWEICNPHFSFPPRRAK